MNVRFFQPIFINYNELCNDSIHNFCFCIIQRTVLNKISPQYEKRKGNIEGLNYFIMLNMLLKALNVKRDGGVLLPFL